MGMMLACLGATMLSSAAYAQTSPFLFNQPNTATTTTQTTTNATPVTATSPDGIMGLISQGNLNGAASSLIKANTGLDANQAMDIVRGLSGNSSDLTSKIQVLSSVIGGQINPELGKMLSGLNNLGNLGNLGNLTNLTAGKLFPGLDLGKLGDQSTAMNQALSALSIAGGGNIKSQIENALKAGAADVVSKMISDAIPGLAQALGGQQGVAGIIANLLGIGGLTINIGTAPKDPDPGGASCACEANITEHHNAIRAHMTNKRKEHEVWMASEFFTNHVAPALMLMADQLTVTAMQQVQIIGSFFDAKHQLESQRLLQQMTAEAHKDYQPSEGICTFGTSVRSLASSERAAELAQAGIAARGMSRQLRNGEGLSGLAGDGESLDRASRMKQFIDKFCDKQDNAKTLDAICTASTKPEQRNRDIDYTRSVENKLTLDIDFHTSGSENPSQDEENIFALAANLYGHDIMPQIDPNTLSKLGIGEESDTEQYLMDFRALAAKRSVAQNSFAAITGMKAVGTAEAQPYLYKMVEELGVPQGDLEKLLGKNPSYFAQMEILTKKALQNPVFYTELYDKPVNVDRKGAVLQAIGLMQDRDIYKSLIRSEAVLSVMLEAMLQEEQDRVAGQIKALPNKSQGLKSNTGGSP